MINKNKRKVIAYFLTVAMSLSMSLSATSNNIDGINDIGQSRTTSSQLETTTSGGLEPEVTPEITPTPEVTPTPSEDPNEIKQLEDGTYLISTPGQLKIVREDLTAKYRLETDIDLQGEDWLPVGNSTEAFTGSFDGNGHEITNFVIEGGSESYIGFFGISKNATLKNLSLRNISVAGKNYVGSLVGYMQGNDKYIENCHVYEAKVTGAGNVGGLVGATDTNISVGVTCIVNASAEADVVATGSKVGGLVGSIKGGIKESYAKGTVQGSKNVGGFIGQSSIGTVEKCYAKGIVEGDGYIGGFIGRMSGTTVTQGYSVSTVNASDMAGGFVGISAGGVIDNCYTISKVTAEDTVGGMIGTAPGATYIENSYASTVIVSEGVTLGGLCSDEDALEVTNSYYDKKVCDVESGLAADEEAAIETKLMRQKKTYEGWNFGSIWAINEDTTYPYLKALEVPDEIVGPAPELEMAGQGTKEDPYIIVNKEQMLKIKENLKAYYALGNDISLAKVEWEPIGTTHKPFTGGFNGNGFTLSDLTLEMSGTNEVGLFGIANDATFEKVKLTNINVTGQENVGALVGKATGTTSIKACEVEGTINGQNNVGGLAGYLEGDIEHAKSSATVEGTNNYVGGLAGYEVGDITASEATEAVVGQSQVGGLVGYLEGNIAQSHGTGSVEGKADEIGGLAGALTGSVTKSYASCDVKGNDNVGGIIGNMKGEVTESYFTGNVVGNSLVGGLVGHAAPATIKDCFALGSVTANDNVAGLVGAAEEAGNQCINSYAAVKIVSSGENVDGLCTYKESAKTHVAKDCYYDSLVSELEYSKITKQGKLTSAMIRKATFANWGFDSVWTIEEGASYPYLVGVTKPEQVLVDDTKIQGLGTEQSPYIITSVAQLLKMKYELGAYYKLGCDIDLEAMTWEPVGSEAMPFTGGLDGNGFKLSNFIVNGEASTNVGFFGVTQNAKLKNITLNNLSVTGKANVGALVGSAKGNSSILTNCHMTSSTVTGTSNVGGLVGEVKEPFTTAMTLCSVTGNVIGNDESTNVGGLVGYLNGKLNKSYSTGDVTGTTNVGGLIGYSEADNLDENYSTARVMGTTNVGGIVGSKNGGEINNSYVLGSVSGKSYVGGLLGKADARLYMTNCYVAAETKGETNVGGLCGSTVKVILKNCYYDSIVSGLEAVDSLQQACLTRTLLQKASFIDWNFDSVWAIEEGVSYPYLASVVKPEGIVPTVSKDAMTGKGTEKDPYIIKTVAQLEQVKYELAAFYKLGNDLDLGDMEWTPIGSKSAQFTGGFDGAGFKISNFTISKGTSDNIGFFGVTNNAVLQNLTLSNTKITGSKYVGALVGAALGDKRVIKNCHVTSGRVAGVTYVGGLVGYVASNGDSVISNCSVDLEVIGTGNYVGSLIGYLVGDITASYAKGTAEGDTYVGGLVGYSKSGEISKCYSTVKVTDGSSVGGIVGYKAEGAITNCYTVSLITGSNDIGGIIGAASKLGVSIKNCYASVETSSTGKLVGGICGDANYMTIENTYYDGAVSGLVQTNPVEVSKLTASMKKKVIYSNWDFTNTWNIDEGKSYPYLKEIAKPDVVSGALPASMPTGSGTQKDPFIIKTAQQLQMMKYEVTACYELANDIDLSFSEWEVVGHESVPFAGTFDGKGHTISNFSISKSTTDYVGFFGIIQNAVIKNVKLKTARVTGKNYVGALVGCALGESYVIEGCSILEGRVAGASYIGGLVGSVSDKAQTALKECAVQTEVIGSGSYVGLLAGYLNNDVTKSYTAGKVEGATYVGGFAGYSEAGTISEGYTTATIIGKTYVGGFVGAKKTGSITDCYILGPVSGSSYVGGMIGKGDGEVTIKNCYAAGLITTDASIGGIYGEKGQITVVNSYYNATINSNFNETEYALSTSALKRQANYKGWDFENLWQINEYKSYAYLKTLPTPDNISGPAVDDLPTGSGTKEDPYLIANKAQLLCVKYNLGAYYKVIKDIDLQGMEWEPIGTLEAPFEGHLDGGGFTISNFVMNKANVDYVGFFGVTNNAVITNLTLTKVNVVAGSNIGILIGLAQGSSHRIENCHVTVSTITGVSYVGGLVGQIHGATAVCVIKCSTDVKVIATQNYVGGVIGYLTGSVSECYATGDVEGYFYVGGLIGYSYGATITMSYSVGAIKGSQYVGALIGYGYGGFIKQSYILGSVTGTNYVGGLIGSSGKLVEIINCYVAGKVTATGTYVGGLFGDVTYIKVTASYYDGILSTQAPTKDSYMSKLTSGMKHKVGFVGWDFEGVWTIEEGTSYPYLKGLPRPSVITGTVVTGSPTGSGTQADPYIITTAAQLINVKFELTAYFKLGCDIDLKGAAWVPLGSMELPFKGHFDGGKFTVSHFVIASGQLDYIGFFGVTSNATIINLSLDKVDITGHAYVGGLIGLAMGESHYVAKCYVKTGTVIGVTYVGGLIGRLDGGSKGQVIDSATMVTVKATGDYVGGLIGYMQGIVLRCYTEGSVEGHYYVSGLIGYGISATIEVSYATGHIIGIWYVGGIVGYSEGVSIKQCYVLGTLHGEDYVGGIVGLCIKSTTVSYCYVAAVIEVTGVYVGGLCATEEFIVIVSSYYDGLVSTISPKLTTDISRLTTGLKVTSTYVGWDFVNIWTIDVGVSYPYLRGLPKPTMINGVVVVGMPQGAGTPEHPYQIETIDNLNKIKFEADAYYALTKDIDLGGIEWTPIGTIIKPFKGHFEGNDHTISNFLITRPSEDHMGFFGVIQDATIQNLVLSTMTIQGNQNVGGLIGYAIGSQPCINNCKVIDGSISGKANVGGVIGKITCASANTLCITGCTSTVKVTGTGNSIGNLIGYLQASISESSAEGITKGANNVGGVAGYNYGGTIENCYSIETVDGTNYVGGITGQNFKGNVANCESLSTVTGRNYVGGVVGYSNTGKVDACESLATVTGRIYVGGIVGYNNGATIQMCSQLAETDGDVLTLIKAHNSEAVVNASNSLAIVTGTSYVGGVMGYTYAGSLIGSESQGTISGTSYVGGLIGFSKGTAVDETCNSSATVEGKKNVGDLVGYTQGV